MPELRAREQGMRAELQAIRDQAADRMSFLRLAETLTAYLQRLRESAESLEITDRQRVVRLLVKEVLVDNDAITIRHSIPAQPKAPPNGNEPPSSSGKFPTAGQSYLLRSGSDRSTLWGSLSARMNLSIFQDARFQPTPDQADQARVTDSMFDKSEDPIVIETPKNFSRSRSTTKRLLAATWDCAARTASWALRPGRKP